MWPSPVDAHGPKFPHVVVTRAPYAPRPASFSIAFCTRSQTLSMTSALSGLKGRSIFLNSTIAFPLTRTTKFPFPGLVALTTTRAPLIAASIFLARVLKADQDLHASIITVTSFVAGGLLFGSFGVSTSLLVSFFSSSAALLSPFLFVVFPSSCVASSPCVPDLASSSDLLFDAPGSSSDLFAPGFLDPFDSVVSSSIASAPDSASLWSPF
mmetsp:Transcript_9367/g.21573  ORF Transcript_9367/g.21573 Transcript_9367/m.21573 type:complete len:211 (-) Transcript_9367:106-738(-)